MSNQNLPFMFIHTLFSRLTLLLIFVCSMMFPVKAQEAVLIDETINWEWNMPKWYGGNSFYWWHRTDVNPDIIDFGEMSSTNWLSPYNYLNGTFYLRFQIIDQPTSTPFSIQLGIWQDINKPGGWSETCSALSYLSGGDGASVQKSIGSPANWWQLRTDAKVDFTRPEDFYRIGILLWKGTGSCIPYGQTWSASSSQCPNAETEAANYFPLKAKITVVAVASGYTFSGWQNYPSSGTKPPTPTYTIDFINEQTNEIVPQTDEYSYNASMSNAVSGTGSKLNLQPGKTVYLRTKASGENPASDIKVLNVPDRPATPNFIYDAVNQRTTTTVSNLFEYASSSSMTNAVTGTGTYVNFSIGTTRYFRRKATTTAFKSNVQALLGTADNTLRIMPLGNSITFDQYISDNRSIGDRISYRYWLNELLNHAGYETDFVGSESAGTNYFTDAENAGFPGITSSQITNLLKTGYNSKDGVQETPGAYLDYYLPDIILMHIGTNNVQESAAEIENILNEIDQYKLRTNKETRVILARIINRQTYNQTTTTFNANVAAMVESRNDSDIILVDMENGAGIDYALDMTDNLHPNISGYKKMAVAWFNKLKEVLPVKSYKPFILVSPVDKGIVNNAYQSGVFAIGSPAPVFTLIEAPSGMTINSQTGVINWLPTTTGNFNVAVRASNAMGSDTLTFNLLITNEEKIVGNSTIYSSVSSAQNRRAQPVTMSETGTISSISIYHGAGSGNVILAIYNTLSGKPNQRMAVTQPTAVNNFTGWQTINLSSPVTVSQGETIWLAWVFENAVSIRYTSGTPGRAQSSLTYSGGMPELFGTSSVSSSIYSIYANYTTSLQLPPAAPSLLTAIAVSSEQANFAWTDNSTDEIGFELERSLTSGSGFQVIATTTANINSVTEIGLIPNQTYYYRVRAFNNQGYSAYAPEVQITMPGSGGTSTVGYTEIFASSSGAQNRRAQPVTMTETGTISSISIYHSAGSGNAILAIYNTSGGLPNQRIAVTQPTAVNSFTGWQTFNLNSPVTVNQGETIWLAWVFENSVSMRYTSGTPGRAQSSLTYSGGMPELFGTSSVSSSIYSIYANYTSSNQLPPAAPSLLTAIAVSPEQANFAWTDNSTDEIGFELERSLTSGSGFQVIATTTANINSVTEIGLIPNQTYYYRVRAFNNQGYSAYTPEIQITMPGSSGSSTVGYTEIFSSLSGAQNRRAQPVTMPETGTISSISIYHGAGTGNVILAIYNTSSGKPNQRIAVSQPTAVNNFTGWQTINLSAPVTVSQGETIWLAWVFENSVSIRYTSGTPGRAQSSLTYSGGMPELFGSSSISSTVYSIYANYTTSSLKFAQVDSIQSSEKNATMDSQFEVYPTFVTNDFTIRFNLEQDEDVQISIYDISGVKVLQVIEGTLNKGPHTIHVDNLQNLDNNSGVMLVQFRIRNDYQIRKIVFSKP